MDLRQQIEALIEGGETASAARLLNEMWRTQGNAASAGFIASRYDRIRESLPLRPCRWAFLRSFTVEPLVPILKAGAYTSGIALETHVGEFNAWAQEMLDPASPLYRFQPDIAVLAVQTRDLAPENALERLSDAVAAFRRNSQAALIVHTLEQPAIPAAGVLDAQQESGEAAAIRRVNAGLVELAKQHRGVYLLDYDALVARHGRQNWGDARKWLTVRLPIASANLPHM
ncbi:MAG TPA: hypothetical protein VNV86_15280, partial [Candidatus Acidoferrum sp.]|nr:hypothetical protein [Candidatus Acidoferrum sp.]